VPRVHVMTTGRFTAQRGRLGLALPPFQFPFDRLPEEVGTLFALLQYGIHARQRSGRKPSWHLFFIDPLAAHRVCHR